MTTNIDLSDADSSAYLVSARMDPETRAMLEKWLQPTRFDSNGTPHYEWQEPTN